jgi:lipopolysaccharide biosynthesis protein
MGLGNNVDVFCSVSSPDLAELICQDFPEAHIEVYENRGRDILPFVNILKLVSPLGYIAACKVHTKKSIYRTDGDLLRHSLLTSLLGSSVNTSRIIQMFKSNDSLGLVCPREFLLAHNDHNMTFNHQVVRQVADAMKLKFRYSYFPAGSMFWFRPEALSVLCRLTASNFPIESGLADGTPAHAVERLFAIAAEHAGFKVEAL